MGCYDEVYVNCPKCGHQQIAQSKGGECLMRRYSLSGVPIDILEDINRHAPFDCPNCGTAFKVIVKLTAETEETTHEKETYAS
jgi:predicted RNA-binding Zn-ribbon protein involved in translation (DUF1610 family)